VPKASTKGKISPKTPQDLRVMYATFWNIFHLVENSKIVMGSATPMINDVNEIVPQMNLLLPIDRQMSFTKRWSEATTQELEPYFRGIISFVRSLDTGAIPTYMYNPSDPLKGDLNTVYNISGQEYRSQSIVYRSVMSEFQNAAVEAAYSETESLAVKERQAACFVFPDGSYGGDFHRSEPDKKSVGISNWVDSPTPDVYYPKEEFKPHITADRVHICSQKYADIIKICSSRRGNCFTYNEFTSGSGAIVLGLCFEAQKYERYMPSVHDTKGQFEEGLSGTEVCTGGVRRKPPPVGKGLRYALITGETSKPRIRAILELYNSYENRHGEYLKVLIGTPISRYGINLANTVQIHLATPTWNEANTYQALSRGIRSTSHVTLLEELREKKIPVEIYAHASVGSKDTGIELRMLRTSEEKNIEIKRMERNMKVLAIDAYNHLLRNIRNTDLQGTPNADYQEPTYQPYTPVPLNEIGTDRTSYDVYYCQGDVESALEEIRQLFQSHFSLSVDAIYGILSETHRRRYIDFALEKIISEKIPLQDKYGYTSYLIENGNAVLLTRDYPISSLSLDRSETSLSFYTENLIVTTRLTLKDYHSIVQKVKGDQAMIAIEASHSKEDIEKRLNTGSIQTNTSLLEKMIIEKYIDKIATGGITADIVLQRFQHYYYQLRRPVRTIQIVDELIQGIGTGRGRKRSAANAYNIKLDKFELLEETNTEMMFIHKKLMDDTDTEFAKISNFSNAEGTVRVYIPSEGKWRDADIREQPVFQKYMIEKYNQLIAQYEGYRVFGILNVRDNIFRLRDTINETEERQRNPKTKETERDKFKGKICSTYHVPELIGTMYHLGLPSPDDDMRRVLNSIPNVAEFPHERLVFYYSWMMKQKTKKAEFCESIRRELIRRNQVIYL
jgi:hypothetical protein